jgi:transposase
MSRKSSKKLYVGMDVHKESIDIALAEEGGEVRHYGRIAGDMHTLTRTVRKLESLGRSLVLVYEAGPCGFGIYRMLRTRAHECWVVAPSNTPRRVRDRIKTDRGDCLRLAGLARAGELEPIYVPDAADEAMRDLVRAREDAVAMQRQARHRLGALLLRNDIRYAGKTAWTDAHRRWISRVVIARDAQRIAFEEYVQAVQESTERVCRLPADSSHRTGAGALALAPAGGGAAGLPRHPAHPRRAHRGRSGRFLALWPSAPTDGLSGNGTQRGQLR